MQNFFFNFLPNFKIAYLCEFLSYDNDRIMKKYIFMGESVFHNFIGARALPRALRAMSDAPKMSFLATYESDSRNTERLPLRIIGEII